jgi:hypothetical protein
MTWQNLVYVYHTKFNQNWSYTLGADLQIDRHDKTYRYLINHFLNAPKEHVNALAYAPDKDMRQWK